MNVALAHGFKAFLKGKVKSAKEADMNFTLSRGGRIPLAPFRTERIHHQRGHERARKEIGGQHGEDHSLGERTEEKSGYALQEENGNENDADTERGDEGRHGNLLSAGENGIAQRHALRHQTVDVFDFYRGIIHQDADSQRQVPPGS